MSGRRVAGFDGKDPAVGPQRRVKPAGTGSAGPSRRRTAGRRSQVSTLGDLSTLSSLPGVRWVTVGESLKDVPRPDKACLPSDLSPFIGEPEENRAWQLLGLTRQALEGLQELGPGRRPNAGPGDPGDLRRRGRRRLLRPRKRGGFRPRRGSQTGIFGVPRTGLSVLGNAAPARAAPGVLGERQRRAGSGGATDSPFFHREGTALRWRDRPRTTAGPGTSTTPPALVSRRAPGTSSPSACWTPLVGGRFSAGRSPPWPTPAARPTGSAWNWWAPISTSATCPAPGEERLLPGRPGLVEPQDAWEYGFEAWTAGAPASTRGRAAWRCFPVKVAPAGDHRGVECRSNICGAIRPAGVSPWP